MNLNTCKKNGFTMIELIAVIVILGVLAAAAVPRFLDATDEAEQAAADGLAGSWLSECGMRVAEAALAGGTEFTCPAEDENDDWSVEPGQFTLSTQLVGTDCNFTVSTTGTGAAELANVTFDTPAEFTANMPSAASE